jgi:hypothetical protein
MSGRRLPGIGLRIQTAARERNTGPGEKWLHDIVMMMDWRLLSNMREKTQDHIRRN